MKAVSNERNSIQKGQTSDLADRRAGRSLAAAAWLAAAALGLAAPTDAPAAVVPVFQSAGGSANHAPGSPGGTNNAAALSAPATSTPGYDSDYNPSVIRFPSGTTTGNTTARLGISHSEGANSARMLFATGTGISQTDPGADQSFSTLEFQFGGTWLVGSTNDFGPPINTAFSMPVGIRTGALGSASVFIDVHWDAVKGTAPFPDAREPFTVNRTYGAGVQLDSFVAPARPFFFASLDPGDTLTLRGTVRFTIDNEDTPSLIEIPTLANFPEFAGRPELSTPASMSVDGVPEPTTAGSLAAAGLLALAARRRRRSTRAIPIP